MSKGSNRRPAVVPSAVVRQNWDAIDWGHGKKSSAKTPKAPKPPKERCPFCRQPLKQCRACKKRHCTSVNGNGCVPVARCKNPARKRNWAHEIYGTTPQGFIVKRGGMVDGPAELDTGAKLAGTSGNGPAWDPSTAAKRESMRTT